MASPRPPHRPTLLTRDLEAVLLAALRATPVKKYAAEHGGISEATWHLWERRGEEQLIERAEALGVDPALISVESIIFEEAPYLHFLLSLRKARSDYLIERLARIRQAGDGIESKTTKTVTKLDASGNEVLVERTETVKMERAWTAEAWLVERQYPEFRTQRLEVTGREGGPVEISQESAAERLARVLDEMVEREAARPGLSEALSVDEPVDPVENPEP